MPGRNCQTRGCYCGDSRYAVVTDKGTLDAVGLSEGHVVNRCLYRQAVWRLLQPGGLLVITSCNSTKDELVAEFCSQDDQNPVTNVTHHSATALTNPCETEAPTLLVETTDIDPEVTDGSASDAFEHSGPDHSALSNGSGVSSRAGASSGNGRSRAAGDAGGDKGVLRAWKYLDHVRTYPVFRFGGQEGSRVATVAFRRLP